MSKWVKHMPCAVKQYLLIPCVMKKHFIHKALFLRLPKLCNYRFFFRIQFLNVYVLLYFMCMVYIIINLLQLY